MPEPLSAKEYGAVSPSRLTGSAAKTAVTAKESAREVTMNLVDEILNEHAHKPKSRKLVISEKKLLKYFEPYYTIDDIEEVVYLLLDQWKRNQGVSESE